MSARKKGWMVILTVLFLGAFLPIKPQIPSRIPADTGDVNPSNPPRFKGYRASPSGIVQFYFSETGKRLLMNSPNPHMRDMGRAVGGSASSRASTGQLPFGGRIPTFDPGAISPICSSVSGCKFNLEAPENALPQNEESVDFIHSGGLQGEDLVIEGANDYRGFFGILESATGYYVSRDADGAPEFDGGLPLVADPLEPLGVLAGGGDPVIAADPARSAVFAADLRFDDTTTGIGVFRTTTAKLNSAAAGDCPDGTHNELQAEGCWPTGIVVNAQNSLNFFQDKPHIAVDERAAGVGAGNVYITGTEFSFFVSRTWLVACNNLLTACSAPIIISGSDGGTQFSHVAVRPDGGITVTYIDRTSDGPPGSFPFLYQVFNIKYVRCSPAAAPSTPSCSPATLVHSETQPLAFGGFLGAQDLRVATYPKHDHRTDGAGTETYVVWDRCKIDPSANPFLFGLICPDADVVAKASTNNGVTWSGLFSIYAPSQDQFFPWIKTDRSRNIVNVAFYTSQADGTFQHRVQVYLNHINPDGVLNVNGSSDTHVITTLLNDPNGDPLLGGFFLGDYIGVAARGTGVDGASRAYCGFTYNDVQGSYSGVLNPQQDNKLVRLDY